MTEKEKLSSPFSIENLLSTTAVEKRTQREDAPNEKNNSHMQSLKRKYIHEFTGNYNFEEKIMIVFFLNYCLSQKNVRDRDKNLNVFKILYSHH